MNHRMTEELMGVAIGRIHELKASGLTHSEETSIMANFAEVVFCNAPINQDTPAKEAFWTVLKPVLGNVWSKYLSGLENVDYEPRNARGYVKTHRNIVNHDIWKRKGKYAWGQAFEFIRLTASCDDLITTVKNHKYLVRRGQVCNTLEYFAERFQWTKQEVSRFLSDLVSKGLITKELNMPIDSLLGGNLDITEIMTQISVISTGIATESVIDKRNAITLITVVNYDCNFER